MNTATTDDLLIGCRWKVEQLGGLFIVKGFPADGERLHFFSTLAIFLFNRPHLDMDV